MRPERHHSKMSSHVLVSHWWYQFVSWRVKLSVQQFVIFDLKIKKQVVRVIWHKAVSQTHMDGSVAFARWRQCTPHACTLPQPGKYNNSAAVDMGDRLATIDMGRKLGVVPPFGRGELGPYLAQCGLGRGLPPYRVASWSMQPFGHSRLGPKMGSVPFWGGELGLRLTQRCLGRGLPPYQVASWSIQPFWYNRYGPKIEGGLYPLFEEGSWVRI